MFHVFTSSYWIETDSLHVAYFMNYIRRDNCFPNCGTHTTTSILTTVYWHAALIEKIEVQESIQFVKIKEKP